LVRVHRLGRLGELLWQYAFAQVLARRFAYALPALPIPAFPLTREPLAGTEILGPEALWEGQWPRDAYSGRSLEPGELLTPPGTVVKLRGGFQRFDLISPARAALRENWLRMESPPRARRATDFLICLQLTPSHRGAEHDKTSLGMASSGLLEPEIRHLVKIVPHRRLYFITDQPRHRIFRSLRDLDGEVHTGDDLTVFRFIHPFQKVALSQSALHWWAAFLGSAREIYFPPVDRGPWSHPEPPQAAWQPPHFGIDVRVDEPRYIYDWHSRATV